MNHRLYVVCQGSTDSEDIAEQSSVVQPYQFEPVADSDNEKHTKTAFFVKLLRRDSKQDVSKYAEDITDEKFGRRFAQILSIFSAVAHLRETYALISLQRNRYFVFVQLRNPGPPQTQNLVILSCHKSRKFSHPSSLRAGCHACLIRNA